MRESPLATLINMPWWINLMIGLGMLAFGELLKISGFSGQAPGKVAFGQSVQFFSIVFLGFAAICFLISCFRDLSGANVQQAKAAPAPPRTGQPEPAPPPPPKKRKYTERDFMPAALRAELDAKEAPAAPEPPLKPTPPPPPPGKKDGAVPAVKDIPAAKTGTAGEGVVK